MISRRELFLDEMGLTPLWRLKVAQAPSPEVAQAPSPEVAQAPSPEVAQAPSPARAPSAETKLIQGVHDRGYLPHLKAEGGIYFVTFRLADSLPQAVLDEYVSLQGEKRNTRIEAYLDSGHGECWLARPAVAELVEQCLLHDRGGKYHLHVWVVMPNHVHLVIEPLAQHALSALLQAIKSSSAHQINKLLGRSGAVWQPESYDHLVRDDDEFARCRAYVQDNPVKAGLALDASAFRFSSAWHEAVDAGGGACATTAENGAGGGACATTAEKGAGGGACATTTEKGAGGSARATTAEKGAGEGAGATAIEDRAERIARMDWAELKATVAACTACGLRKTCTQTVFGVGDEEADWLLVGEAPGAEEDARGEPFVGQAGRLLDGMLAGIDLKRGEDVYIANVLKCRPPGNRNPGPVEVAQCAPHLMRQVELIQPRLILAMGRFACQSLLDTDASIASLRGRMHRYRGVPLIVTYHPAYLLRSLPDKAKAWEDLCFARRTMAELRARA